MPLHDAVGIICKKGATTENQGSGVKCIGNGVYLDDCVWVLSDLTTPTLMEGESHGIILLLLSRKKFCQDYMPAGVYTYSP